MDKQQRETKEVCPKCGGSMRLSRQGSFWGCSRWPDCKGTIDASVEKLLSQLRQERSEMRDKLMVTEGQLREARGQRDAAIYNPPKGGEVDEEITAFSGPWHPRKLKYCLQEYWQQWRPATQSK